MTRYSDFSSLPLHEAINRELTAMLDAQPEDDILDVGCGSGELLRLMPDGSGVRVGVDADANVIADAIENLDPSVQLLHGDADQWLELANPESFDLVMAANCIHLFDEIPATVARLARVLRPGGSLGVCTAYYTEAVDASQRPIYAKILRAAQRACGEMGVRPSRSERNRATRRQLNRSYYEAVLSAGDLAVSVVKETSHRLDREFLTRLATTPVFATGALPGVDLPTAVAAARIACDEVLGSFGEPVSLERRWLSVLAHKGV